MTARFVRQAIAEDAQAAVTVWRDSVTHLCVADHQNDGPMLQRWLRSKTVEQFHQMLADPDNYVVVAGEEADLCGIGHLDRSGELYRCYVRPGRQRSGFGSAIPMALEAQGGGGGSPKFAFAAPLARGPSTSGTGTFQPGLQFRHMECSWITRMPSELSMDGTVTFPPIRGPATEIGHTLPLAGIA
jgi:hypothetical protein